MGRKPKRPIKVTAGTRQVTQTDRVIGQRVRARRLELHITQEQLATRLGLTFQQIQKYEKGTNRIGSGRLVEIANVLQVEPIYFLGDLKTSGATASRFTEFLATTDGVKINEAMMRLDETHRRSIIDLAQTMVRAYGN